MFGPFAETDRTVRLHLQNTYYTETTSMKMIVLPHPQGITRTPMEK